MITVFFYLILVIVLVAWVEGELKFSTNSLKKAEPSEELEGWLKTFQWGNRHQIQEKLNLPRYKFYTEIIETLLSLARRLGGNYQESLLFLRDGLQSDRQFEKKLKELELGCWLQMLMILILTWAFIFASLTLVKINISWIKLGALGAWQSIGLILLPLFMNFYRKKFFSDIGKLWKMLFILSALARVPLARSEVFNLAGIKELELIRQSTLKTLAEKLKVICREALLAGRSYEDDVKFLMEELRFQEKWHFELFEKRLLAIKLGLLGLFFLPSYLAFVFLLLGDLTQRI